MSIPLLQNRGSLMVWLTTLIPRSWVRTFAHLSFSEFMYEIELVWNLRSKKTLRWNLHTPAKHLNNVCEVPAQTLSLWKKAFFPFFFFFLSFDLSSMNDSPRSTFGCIKTTIQQATGPEMERMYIGWMMSLKLEYVNIYNIPQLDVFRNRQTISNTSIDFKHQSMILSIHINNIRITLWFFATLQCASSNYFSGTYYYTDRTTFYFVFYQVAIQRSDGEAEARWRNSKQQF